MTTKFSNMKFFFFAIFEKKNENYNCANEFQISIFVNVNKLQHVIKNVTIIDHDNRDIREKIIR